MAKRIALLIGNTHYRDKRLARLITPAADIQGLAAVLRDANIGNFNTVETIIDQPAAEACRRIADLFHRRKRHDMLLLYFLGHGLLDEFGQLYLATVDTALDSLAGTAIPATSLTEHMDRSFSRQQILLLDCYFSANCPPETVAGPGLSVGTAAIFKGEGRGRIVLTATDLTHYALAGSQVIGGEVEESTFTHHLIQGLRTGTADADEDGQIGVRELYDYVHRQVTRQTNSHKPRQWTYREQDKFIIARNQKLFKPPAIKWDLIFGAVMAPVTTIAIGGQADLPSSVGMAGLFLLMYAGLYLVLD